MKRYVKGCAAIAASLALSTSASAQSTGSTGGTTSGSFGSGQTGTGDTSSASPTKKGEQPPATGQTGANNGSSGSKSSKSAKNQTGTQEVLGTVTKIAQNKLSVDAEDGSQLTLKTDSKTKVYRSTGQSVKLTQIPEGAQVRASYDQNSSGPHALRIDVLPAAPSGDSQGSSGSVNQPGTDVGGNSDDTGTPGSKGSTGGSDKGNQPQE